MSLGLRIFSFSFAYRHINKMEVSIMTEKQKADIIELRSKGLKYSDIADRLQLSINTVKSFYRRCKDTVSSAHCKCCGRPISQPLRTREKKFCSDECRMNWWNSHKDEINKKAVYHFKCESCGQEFQAYGNNHRKYCSRECYINMRFGGGNSEK